jgi:NADP-dependent 3-hydroxy acid dehydrogenase YdfG
MNLNLANRLALVTGSTAGIGYAIAEALVREGACVIVNGRSQSSVDDALTRLKARNGDVAGFAGDLSTAAAVEKLGKEFPEVEILVNNLGIFEPKPFENIPDEDWRRLFEVNVLSGVRLARLFLPGMKRRNWGRIIFISSESGIQIPSEMIHYGMTKTAARCLARACRSGSWNRHYREFNIARTDEVARGRRFRRIAREVGGKVVGRVRARVFRKGAADFADQALCHTRGSRIACCVRCKSPCFGDDGRCVARRWRRHKERILTRRAAQARIRREEFALARVRGSVWFDSRCGAGNCIVIARPAGAAAISPLVFVAEPVPSKSKGASQ